MHVLQGVDFTVNAGERVAIVGASGSGKSTLLNLLGGLDSPSAGEVFIGDQKLTQVSEKDKEAIRNQQMGFVYQFHHLLPEFSAEENVAMPCMIGGAKKAKSLAQAAALLKRVGLEQRLAHKPSQLSGGERQRVAIARALVNDPRCVLMDEPTGNLDSHNAERVQQLLFSLAEERATSCVVVTHDMALAEKMDAIFELHEGRLEKRK